MMNDKIFQRNLERILKVMHQVERTVEKPKIVKSYSASAPLNYKTENTYYRTTKNKYKDKHTM